MCKVSLIKIMQGRPYPESGRDLYDILDRYLSIENKIILDMDGVISLPSMFLNVSLGKIIDKYGVSAINGKIEFAHISSSQARRINEYVEKVVQLSK